MGRVLRSGDRVGDWVVDEPLGEGGMGAVYRVHSALAGRLVAALKVMKPTSEADGPARFAREAETLSALRHPAIVRVMGFGEDRDHGLLYLAMEFAEGETLASRLERGPLPLTAAVEAFTALASALEHAHRAGIFHRDIKPSNIVLSAEGAVRLVDFGIAIQHRGTDTITSTHRGTLSYLPPEAFRGETPDPGCMDVYALGLVLHESLTGRKSFRVDAPLAPAAAAAVIGARKLDTPPLDPGERFPAALREVIRQATQRDPKARPSVEAFHAVLASAATRDTPAASVVVPSGGPAEPTVDVPDPDTARSRRAALVALAGLVPVVVALGLLVARAREPSSVAAPVTSSAPSTTAAREAAPLAPAGDVTGRWDVANHIEASEVDGFRGLRLGYELTLRQQGRRVSGEGRKVSENGEPLPEARRTPILVTGESEGRTLRLSFMERGAQRNTAGTLEWELSADGRSVAGTFASDAAGSRGSSVARRVPGED